MPFETTCPHCGTRYRDVPDDHVGSNVRCRSCQQVFEAEELPAEPPQPEEPPVIPGEIVSGTQPIAGSADAASAESPRITFADIDPVGPETPDPSGEEDQPAPAAADQPASTVTRVEAPPPPRSAVDRRPAAADQPTPQAASPLTGEPPEERPGESEPSASTEPAQPDAAGPVDKEEQQQPDEDARSDDRARIHKDLLPVVSRLDEIRKRCLSLTSRHDELGELAPILGSIIDTLKAGHGPRGEELDFREVAAQLMHMPRLFEKRGFQTMAREVEHVEQALSDLQASRLGPADHSDEQDVDRESSARTVADVGPRVHSAAVRSEDDLAPKERPGRRLAVTAAAVVAGLALVVLVVVFLLRPVTDDLSDSGAAAVLEPSPTPRPTAPAATPTRVPVDPSRVRLAELLADARHERQLGNLDAAIEHLSVLALIDRDDTSVLETAQGIIADLKRLAEQAAQEEDGWRAAKAHLDRARDLALRFGMETREIDRLWRNIGAMELTHRLAPTDTTALQARVGTEVDVILRSGETETGWLKAVTRTLITLETRDRFGGGYVTYDSELQVSAIEAIEYTTPVVPQ